MTFIAAGIAAAAVVGGAAIAADAAGDAAETGAAASDRATAEQRRMFDKQVSLQEPWRRGGEAGLNALLQYTGLLTPQQVQQQGAAPVFDEQAYLAANPDVAAEINAGQNRGYSTGEEHYAKWGRGEGRAQPMTTAAQVPGSSAGMTIDSGQFGAFIKPAAEFDFEADPGYQFRLQEGQRGLEAAARATYGTGSGKFMKDAMRFNQGLAAQEYGQAYARNTADTTNRFNRLAAVAGIGQTSANTLTNAAGVYGQQAGANIIGAGNAVAAGQVGSANAWNNAIGQGVGLYNQNQLLNRVYPQGGTPVAGGTTPPNPWATSPGIQYNGSGQILDWYA